MPEIDPVARLLGGLEQQIAALRDSFARHAEDDVRAHADQRVETREAIERTARDVLDRQTDLHRQNLAVIRRIEETIEKLTPLVPAVTAMQEMLRGADGEGGLVEAMRQVTSILDGNKGRRAAFALVGTLIVAIVGIGSGIANLWHLVFPHR
jgi:hypothetical protein